MGSNQQPLDSKPNALPTELRREICGVGFKFYCTVLYIATMLHQEYTGFRQDSYLKFICRLFYGKGPALINALLKPQHHHYMLHGVNLERHNYSKII